MNSVPLPPCSSKAKVIWQMYTEKEDKEVGNGSLTTAAYKKASRNTLLLWNLGMFTKKMPVRLRS